jgi:hypothetical protein
VGATSPLHRRVRSWSGTRRGRRPIRRLGARSLSGYWLGRRLGTRRAILSAQHEKLAFAGLSEVAEGVRTLDLLHGKQNVRPRSRAKRRRKQTAFELLGATRIPRFHRKPWGLGHRMGTRPELVGVRASRTSWGPSAMSQRGAKAQPPLVRAMRSLLVRSQAGSRSRRSLLRRGAGVAAGAWRGPVRLPARPAAPSLGAARLHGDDEDGQERGEESRHDQPAEAADPPRPATRCGMGPTS